MELRILQPDKIIVSGEYELENRSILQIYFKVFERGHGADLPPAIVTTSGSLDSVKSRLEECFNEYENRNGYTEYNLNEAKSIIKARREDCAALFKILQQNKYLLIDGIYNTAAATLTHNPIQALEIQANKDFEEIELMIKNGDLFGFNRTERDLDELRDAYIAYCLGLSDDRIPPRGIVVSRTSVLKDTKTIKEWIDELTSNRELPEYMKEMYLHTK